MKELRSQEEIINSWDSDYENPVVSICCITYNHNAYIKDALNGFLMQKTDFPFEIVIHDDASTDGTADIIREYETDYPELFRPIYQKENQYSKMEGGAMNPTFNYPRAKGKYIALCEGDDYWTDPLKLQKQVEFMEKNEEYSLIVHKADKTKNDKKNGNLAPFSEKENKDFTAQDILTTRGQFAATSSYFFSAEVLQWLPSWLDQAPVGDFIIEMYAMKCGKGCYMPTSMSVYRQFSNSSWSNDTLKNYNSFVIFSEQQLKIHTLLKEDFPKVEEEAFDFRKSFILYGLSLKSLAFKKDNKFRSHINQWKACAAHINVKKGLIYSLRRYPSFLRILFRAFY